MKNFIILALICCSCGTTVSIQGVKVHSPQRTTPKTDALLYAGATIAGYAVADHLTSPQTKNEIRQKLKIR